MNNKLIVPIVILIAGVLILVGGYMILTPHQESIDEGQDDTEEHVGESSSGAHMPKMTVSAERLEKNAKPSFEVGKKYKYKTTSQRTENYCTDRWCKNETRMYNMLSEFSVEKTERIDGKECYVVSRRIDRKFTAEEKREMRRGMSEEVIEELEKRVNSRVTNFCYDKETGRCTQVKESSWNSDITLTKEMAESAALESILFSEWMLALSDDFIWERKINSSHDMGEEIEIEEYLVNGREKVNGRECFKVEITSKIDDIGKQKRNSITIIWVDVKERIMVKTTTRWEGLSTSETELVDEQ
jgi:hypothetical protein